jgi:hypothetical protein
MPTTSEVKRVVTAHLSKGFTYANVGHMLFLRRGFGPIYMMSVKGVVVSYGRLDMLVMFDQGLYSYDMVADICQRGAQVLGRILPYVKLTPIKPLNDGSYLAYIMPSDYQRRKSGERLLVKVLEYTIDDPQRTGHQQLHRLVTTLFDPLVCPALELICLYHERWEIEVTFDELDTHQLCSQPLRSHKPVGVIKDLNRTVLLWKRATSLI